MRRFIHLRLHTEYSLLEGAVRLKSLPELARAGRCPRSPSPTPTTCSRAGVFRCRAGAGVQPIIGCQVSLGYGPRPAPPGRATRRTAPLVLLAQNEAGYRNLLKLNSALYLRDATQEPHVTPADLAAHGAGVICLTGGPEGPVGRLLQDGHRARAEALVQRLAGIYEDRLYVELQRHPATAASRSRPSGSPSAAMSRSPMRWICRWWPPTTCISPRPRCTRRMTR